MSLTRLVARPMLASYFVADGLDAVIRPASHVEKVKKVAPMLEKAGLPTAFTSDLTTLTRIVGGISAVTGLMLATGRRPRTAALALALVNVPATLANNPVWEARTPAERKDKISGLLRGASLGGGLLVAAADLAGKPSLGWRVSNARQQRAQLRETKAAVKAKYTA